jgi:hypothetical protein
MGSRRAEIRASLSRLRAECLISHTATKSSGSTFCPWLAADAKSRCRPDSLCLGSGGKPAAPNLRPASAGLFSCNRTAQLPFDAPRWPPSQRWQRTSAKTLSGPVSPPTPTAHPRIRSRAPGLVGRLGALAHPPRVWATGCCCPGASIPERNSASRGRRNRECLRASSLLTNVTRPASWAAEDGPFA